MKISELARKNGLRPSEANAAFPTSDEGNFVIRLFSYPENAEKAERYDKFLGQLGISMEDRLTARLDLEYPEIKAKELVELEDIVDRALSLAPSARTRRP